MWECKMCGTKNQGNKKCVNCSFDDTTDCIKYRTLSRISKETLAKLNQKYYLSEETKAMDLIYAKIKKEVQNCSENERKQVVEDLQALFDKVKNNIQIRLNEARKQECLEQIVSENSAATHNEVEEIFKIGTNLIRENKYQTGLKWLYFAAEHGSKNANLVLGYCYGHGIGVEKNQKTAEQYYRKGFSPHSGVSSSGFFYGRNSFGVVENELKKAEERGKDLLQIKESDYASKTEKNINGTVSVPNVGSQKQLSATSDDHKKTIKEKFEIGRSMLQKKQYQSGLKWIRFAAENGYKDANFILGYCYGHGLGVEKNTKAAEEFYCEGMRYNPNFLNPKYSYGRRSFGVWETEFIRAEKYGKMLIEG